MHRSLTGCFWGIVALGVLTCAWLGGPVDFTPYVFLGFAFAPARSMASRALLLGLALFTVCLQFWFLWDSHYVHFTTMDGRPMVVSVVVSFVAAVARAVIGRLRGNGGRSA